MRREIAKLQNVGSKYLVQDLLLHTHTHTFLEQII